MIQHKAGCHSGDDKIVIYKVYWPRCRHAFITQHTWDPVGLKEENLTAMRYLYCWVNNDS